MTAIVYVPVLGTEIDFRSGNDQPYRLIALDGIGPVDIAPVTRKSPGQTGITAVDVTAPERIVSLQAILQANSLDALWALRSALARAMSVEPSRSATYTTYPLGTLRVIERASAPDLELSCIPRSVHLPQPKANVGILPCDIEFFAPQPYWRALYTSQLWFGAGNAGLQYPIQWPIQFATNNIQQEAINDGDVGAPVTMRIYGALTNPKLTNVTTGEAIEVDMSIAAGDYLEISTEFGDKRVELHTAGGAVINEMNNLNLAIANFWRLLPGSNQVKFEATVNTSGTALLLWRSRYSGI